MTLVWMRKCAESKSGYPHRRQTAVKMLARSVLYLGLLLVVANANKVAIRHALQAVARRAHLLVDLVATADAGRGGGWSF
jgi:hypothetical protein